VHDTGKKLGSFHEDVIFADPDPAVAAFLRTEEGRVEGFDPDAHCFMMACGAVQMAHLKMYDLPVVHGPEFGECEDPDAARTAFCRAVDWVQDALQLETLLPELEDLSVDDVRYDPHKSAGAYYRLQGFKKRGEVEEIARGEARHVLVSLLHGIQPSHRPTRIGGRGKPVSMSKSDAMNRNVRKGRAIHMTDTRDGFVLGLTEQPLNDAWKPRRFPISVGRGWFHGDAVDFCLRGDQYGETHCFDAEKFDSSLMPWLIHVAITIMRMQFTNGLEDRYDMYWNFVEESLLHSFVYRDDGVLFEKWLGTSSGHNHNSLVQSICTLIMSAFNVFYENPTVANDELAESWFAEGLGDDNLSNQSDNLHCDALEVRAKRVWGVFRVSWMGNKSFATNVLYEGYVKDENWDEAAMYGSAQYLGKYFRKWPVGEIDGEVKWTVIPHRPLQETVVRMLYPEKVRQPTDEEDVRDYHGDARGGRWAGHLLDGSGNPLTRIWLRDFYYFCLNEEYSIVSAIPRKMLARWERQGMYIDVEEIDFTQMSFQDWLGLTSKLESGDWATLN
jgi:hypothetical protein